jgi:hypothetical protein
VCDCAFTNLIFNGGFRFGKSQNSQGTKPGLLGVLTFVGDIMLCQKNACPKAVNGQALCRDGVYLLAWSLLMRLSHSTQAQSTASHCRLTSPTDECSRRHSKFSSEWLQIYIMATRLVSKLFKMSEYFPDSPRMYDKCCIIRKAMV